MSQWDDRIRNHAAWGPLKLLGPAIDLGLAREGIDAVSIASLERLRTVLCICGKKMAAADPLVCDPRIFDKLNASLTAIVAEVQGYTTDGNVNHLSSANSQADDLVRNLSLILTTIGNDELSGISESITAYRATLEKNLAEALASHQTVKTEADANRSNLAELTAAISTEKEKLSSLAVTFQTQFTADQTARNAEFTAAQTDRQASHAAKEAEFQTTFAATQAERQEKYIAVAAENQALFTEAQQARAKENADTLKERQDKIDAVLLDYTIQLGQQAALSKEERTKAEKRAEEHLTSLKIDYEQSAKKIMDAIVARKEEVEKLVGVIGNLGVTSGYLKAANHARMAMYVWQATTVASLGTLIYFAYLIAFSAHFPDAAFYQGLATRIFLSITVGVFAAYAARQADKASMAERRNRKLALEFEALGPYIAPLPAEMQNKFRAELGERSFGMPDGDGQKASDNSPSPTTVMDVLNSKVGQEMIAQVVKLVQANRS